MDIAELEERVWKGGRRVGAGYIVPSEFGESADLLEAHTVSAKRQIEEQVHHFIKEKNLMVWEGGRDDRVLIVEFYILSKDDVEWLKKTTFPAIDKEA